MQAPDFWQDHEHAGKQSKELNRLKEEVSFWERLEETIQTYLALSDEELETLAQEIRDLKKSFDNRYIATFLSGKYDASDAVLSIHSGAGGVDAQDWASMLLAMYEKYAAETGFSFSVIHSALGEQGGIKNASIEISGRYAYGMLRGEAGVHRLVRISPFSAKSLRHTSFALVDVIPMIKYADIAIDPKDLEFDTFKSSGPGGQNVNKLETAVRVTHIPTKISVAVQSERSQAQNKEKAIAFLKSKLAVIMEQRHAKEISDLRTDTAESDIEWGHQIRSYVLHPYKLVKDNRTNIESTNPDSVLGGNLQAFIEAEIMMSHNDKV